MGVQYHGMWAHNIVHSRSEIFFLHKTTGQENQPSTFQVEISKFNQDVPTEPPRPLNRIKIIFAPAP